jgi:cytochrome P450
MSKARVPVGHIDVTIADFALDPVAGYNSLRAKCPISWQPPFKGYLFTRFKDVAQALRSPSLAETNPFSGWHSIARKLGKNYEATLRLFDFMPFIHEGEKHKRLRAALAKGLVPFSDANAVFDHRVAQSLGALLDTGEFDLARDFSGSLFFETLCDLMGFPEEPREAIRPLSRLSFALDATLPVRVRDEIERTISISMDALVRQVGDSLRATDGSLLHSIREALPADEPDQEAAIAHLATTMFLMGSDAISGCIAIAVRHLLISQGADPDSSQRLWHALSDDAIRFVAPVDYLTRLATADLTVGDFRVHAGERIIASPLAANHDPESFGPDANSIKHGLQAGVGMAFGAGAHMCVGARIARNIVRSAFAGLSQIPAIAIAGESEQNPGRVVRSLGSLPVRFK